MKERGAMMAVLAAATLASSVAAEEKLQKLSGGQIRAKIAGMELTDEVHWRELHARSGTVTSNSMGRKRTGQWRIEKDQLCIEFDKEPARQMLRGMHVGKKGRTAAGGSIAVARGGPAAGGREEDVMQRFMTLAVAMAGLPAIALAQGALASTILLLRPEPGRRSGDDEGEICLDRRPAAPGQLSGYEPGVGRLEGLFALRRGHLYLRLCGDCHGGRSRAGAGGNPRSGQSLSRGGPGRGRRAIVSQLRRFARRRAPGCDHAEHGSNRQQETRRSSHRFCPQKLGVGMTVSSAILLDRTADRAPALMQVAGLSKRYGEQRALADISFAVNAGEVLGLIGPNGAGKTTLMEAVAGVLAA